MGARPPRSPSARERLITRAESLLRLAPGEMTKKPRERTPRYAANAKQAAQSLSNPVKRVDHKLSEFRLRRLHCLASASVSAQAFA
jgi:hypothetical protein